MQSQVKVIVYLTSGWCRHRLISAGQEVLQVWLTIGLYHNFLCYCLWYGLGNLEVLQGFYKAGKANSVAQSDAHLIGDQQVVVSIPPPPWSGNIIRWRLVSFYSLVWSKKAVVSSWQKNVHKNWSASLRTKPAQKKSVVR